jgi:hypothetical protein
MPKSHAEWKVLDHGPLEALAENLWRVTGAVPGMSLKRTMVVARKGDGALVVHSAIALREEVMRELEALGGLAYLVVPSAMHRLDAPAYKRRFPDLEVFAPSGSRAKVEEVLPIDGTYGDFPHDDAVRLELLAGVRDAEGVMRVRSSDGTSLVLNDAMFNMDRKRDPLGFLFTTMMGSAPGPRVSRLAKHLLVEDQAALRADLLRFAEVPDLVRLIVAHEKVAHGPDAAASLRAASAYLRAR